MTARDAPTLITFGVFEFDLTTGDLWKAGHRVRLQEQSRHVLATLAARPGQLVTRDDLRTVLWPVDTFVDSETGLNVVVNKVRQALGDSASEPRFIETLPRRGYRFIAPVTPVWNGRPPVQGSDVVAAAALESGPGETAGRTTAPIHQKPRHPIQLLTKVALLTVAVGSAWGWRSHAPPLAESRVRTLAVLPLENLSGDAADGYFTDGITEALITNLASIRAVNVIARQSTKQYKGSTKSISTIAKELGGVDAVVEGSVLRTGNRVRVSVQLIDGHTDRHLWTRTYEQDLRDLLQVQREAARTVADEIRATLTPAERARLGSASLRP